MKRKPITRKLARESDLTVEIQRLVKIIDALMEAKENQDAAVRESWRVSKALFRDGGLLPRDPNEP